MGCPRNLNHAPAVPSRLPLQGGGGRGYFAIGRAPADLSDTMERAFGVAVRFCEGDSAPSTPSHLPLAGGGEDWAGASRSSRGHDQSHRK